MSASMSYIENIQEIFDQVCMIQAKMHQLDRVRILSTCYLNKDGDKYKKHSQNRQSQLIDNV